jgi:hypothetical protein
MLPVEYFFLLFYLLLMNASFNRNSLFLKHVFIFSCLEGFSTAFLRPRPFAGLSQKTHAKETSNHWEKIHGQKLLVVHTNIEKESVGWEGWRRCRMPKNTHNTQNTTTIFCRQNFNIALSIIKFSWIGFCAVLHVYMCLYVLQDFPFKTCFSIKI